MSLTTFRSAASGFDAGRSAGEQNPGLFATIVGALYGGVLMQPTSLFRASKLIFRHPSGRFECRLLVAVDHRQAYDQHGDGGIL